MVKRNIINRVGDALIIEGWLGSFEDLKRAVEEVTFVNFIVSKTDTTVSTERILFEDIIHSNDLSIDMTRVISGGKALLHSLDVIMLFHNELSPPIIVRNKTKELQPGQVMIALDCYTYSKSKVIMAGRKAYLMPGVLEVFETIDPYQYNISTGDDKELGYSFLSIPKNEVRYVESNPIPHGSNCVSVFTHRYIGWKFDRRFKGGFLRGVFNTQKQLMEFLCK